MQFESILKSLLDNHVPIKTKLMPLQKPTPWFTEEVKKLKQIMQRREKIWRKYKLDSTWIVFKVARNRYKNALREAKLLVVSEKVVECGTDTCKLYSLVNSLTGATITNPMPDNKGSDEELADQFSEFFMDKVTKIRQGLDIYLKYDPPYRQGLNHLEEFNRMCEVEVLLVIKRMAAKTCGSDPLPSSLFKDLAPHIIGIITELVNISFN